MKCDHAYIVTNVAKCNEVIGEWEPHGEDLEAILDTCNNYRLISLMGHITKIILRVIMNRIKKKIHDEVS